MGEQFGSTYVLNRMGPYYWMGDLVPPRQLGRKNELSGLFLNILLAPFAINIDHDDTLVKILLTPFPFVISRKSNCRNLRRTESVPDSVLAQ